MAGVPEYPDLRDYPRDRRESEQTVAELRRRGLAAKTISRALVPLGRILALRVGAMVVGAVDKAVDDYLEDNRGPTAQKFKYFQGWSPFAAT